MKVKRTERGWAGHFICANRCRFRRNTLLEAGDIKIVVSSVGAMEDSMKEGQFDTIGHERYYETMVFHAKHDDTRWHDMDVDREISFQSECAISELDAEDKANEMHEQVVKEITGLMKKGEQFERREQ